MLQPRLTIFFCFIFLQVVFANRVYSTVVNNYRYTDAWFLLLNNARINENWSIGNEFHYRLTNFYEKKEQMIIRPFINYHINEKFILSGDYSYIRTYPHAPYPQRINYTEHNIWEQATLNHGGKLLEFSHRYRLEHRFREKVLTGPNNRAYIDGYSRANRFRYRLTMRINVSPKFFFNLFDEVWINSDRNIEYARYDRNWLYVGLGYKFHKNGNIQIAYLHQHIDPNLKDIYEIMRSGPQLSIQQDLDFRKSTKL